MPWFDEVFLSMDEAAAYVGMTAGEFWDAVLQHKIPDPIPVSSLRWSKTDLDEVLELEKTANG